MENLKEDINKAIVPFYGGQPPMLPKNITKDSQNDKDVSSNIGNESTNCFQTAEGMGSCSENREETVDKETEQCQLVAERQGDAISPETRASTTEEIPYCKEELKPTVGKRFKTIDEAMNFYDNYAKTCGFTMRREGEKRNTEGVITYKTCVCNKQGNTKTEGKIKRRSVTRFQCNARANFKRTETGEYEVYKFIEDHTHPMVTPSAMVHLKRGRELNLVHKKMIMDNSRVNHGPVKTFRMFKEYVRGYKNVGASLEDFKNFSRDIKKFIKEYDAQMLIETFMQKKAICTSFFFDFEVDEDQNLNKIFWADPIGIKNYALFGDSCSFDTTFDFNKYKMVFAPFTGVDNHKRCVTFAAGLIAKEDADSFSWLFENFLKAMGGCYPTTLITDQCLGIKAGVEKVFSDKTQHRFCMWHIMKKMPEKVGPIVSRDTEFLKEISSIVWSDDIEPQQFEEEWKTIIEKYQLNDNEWLTLIFEMRESWIPSYFRDTYLGGIMRTTSRSESENSFFSNFTNPQLSLVEFWMRFQTAMDAQRWKHSKLSADSKNTSPVVSTPLLIEKQACEFYTPSIFYEFQEEFNAACFHCGLDNIRKDGNTQNITVVDRARNKVCEVVCDENNFRCSCKRFERLGVLCRHVLWVLKDKGFTEIPMRYMLSRWSKLASCRPIFNVAGTTLLEDCASVDTRQLKIGELWSEVFMSVSLVENDENQTDKLLEMLRNFNENLITSGVDKKGKRKKAEIEMLIGSKIPDQAVVLPPKQSKNKGSGKRIISDREKATQENQKPLRRCRACGEMTNHDSRNCDKIKKSKKKR